VTIVKVCGIASVHDALSIADAGADMIGLVFAASRRRVSLDLARRISTAMRQRASRPALTGVFVNETAASVNFAARECGLDIVQLSGDESWDYCRDIDYPVIKAMHVSPNTRVVDVLRSINLAWRAEIPRPFMGLLDTGADGKHGGSGKLFNWEIARRAGPRLPVMLAGGLHARNVRQAISMARPLGVDVSSGVETDGRKDLKKVSDFIEAVRSADMAIANGVPANA
jgi:phosphoribosylanthranilate isomerase